MKLIIGICRKLITLGATCPDCDGTGKDGKCEMCQGSGSVGD